jgi:dsDNA-binding SOS-regulon protein
MQGEARQYLADERDQFAARFFGNSDRASNDAADMARIMGDLSGGGFQKQDERMASIALHTAQSNEALQQILAKASHDGVQVVIQAVDEK